MTTTNRLATPLTLTYRSIDRCYVRRTFKTLAGARRFAIARVGAHPEISDTFGYAVSDDGVGKIEAPPSVIRLVFGIVDDTPESDAAFLGISLDTLQHGGRPWTGATLDERRAEAEAHAREHGGDLYASDFPAWPADGDARRCPRHPHVKTSSDDGLHDAPCGECEGEGEMEDTVQWERAEQARAPFETAASRRAFEARGLTLDLDGPALTACPYCDTVTQYHDDHDCAGLRAESGEAAHDAAADCWPDDIDF